MPEFAVTEYGNLLSNECDVWFTWDVFNILTITESTRPELFSEFHFNFGVLATDTRHIVMDLFRSFLHRLQKC